MPAGIVFDDAKTAMRAAIDAYFGPIPSGLTGDQIAAINQRRDELASVIATACTYVRDNAIVHPDTMAVIPADMTAPSGGGPLSGDGIVHLGTGSLS